MEIKKGYSPMMQHYLSVKEKYNDCIVLYRLGDFYEIFFEDAVLVSKLLDLTLTARDSGLAERAPMCGMPYHSVDSYIAKLVSAGYKVAICEQLTEPKPGQMVERDVVRVITAGTVTDDIMLDEARNNYIMCLCLDTEGLSVVYADITTGVINLNHFKENQESSFSDLYTRITPSQVIGNKRAKFFYNDLAIQKLGNMPKFEEYYDFAFEYNKALSNVEKQFGENAKVVFELKDKLDICAIGALIEYLGETQKRLMKNINKIVKHTKDNFLVIDSNTRRNLELVESIRERKKYGSLLWLMDKTKTSMGARYFRTIFDQPLRDSSEINMRLDSVEELSKNLILRDKLSLSLGSIRDIERISGKIGYGNVYPRDLVALTKSLEEVPIIKDMLKNVKSKKLVMLQNSIGDFSELTDLLSRAINENPPAVFKDGGYIKEGFNDQLDEFRNIRNNTTEIIKELERREQETTNIKTLKVGYNSVFGYYIEVSKRESELVPLRYVRKQTLANYERYTTNELKNLEDKIVDANENSIKLEYDLYKTLVEYLTNFIKPLQDVSSVIAQLDALLSLAECAVKYNFTKPTINKNIKTIKIQDGRHPIVENFVKEGFIANDTLLDCDQNKMMIITGPNMAGKSTYMRQVALIVFLAHIGSFVPARSAEISLTDRIFTRVGASDDLAFGQSTFMVEMSEVATILANATEKSLVVLDEIGRGTSTFDGLSIAWAVVEHIAKNLSCKTLFATHYHELSELEGVINGVKNYRITVKEIGDNIVFLRKIVRGAGNKSFGIEVASLAGVPKSVIERAKEISVNLEKVNTKLDLNIFKQDEERQRAEKNSKKGLKLLSILNDIDLNRTTPMEAFEILNDLVNKAKED